MTDWDKSVDLLIVGSGGGGMVAALAALDSGIEPLVVEKQALVGGATGMSGGMVWLPNNPLMRAEGVPDSHEDGLAYFDDVVGDIGEASSPARREVFLTAGNEMINFLVGKGVRLVRCPGYSDYYPNHKGGNAAGRSVEGVPYDAAALGDWSDKLQRMDKNWNRGFVVKTSELRSVQYFNRSPRAFAVAMRVFLRTRVARLRRREILTNGASLIGQMLKVLIDHGGEPPMGGSGEPPIWTNTAMDDLIVEDGRVVGARVTRDGTSLHVQARKGVLLAAGGFSRNAEMRRRYSGDQPNEAKWSIANPGDTGEVLQTAMRLGANTDLLDEAWWLPTVFVADPRAIGSGRQRPGAIYVDGTGKRFCNESNSYVEVGKAMYANKAVPCWQVFDEGYLGRYVSGANPFQKRTLSEELIEQGSVKRAATIGDLARQIDVPAEALEQTVKRFNDFAANGLDPDFGRGQSAYNICLGDPGYKPNAALGPIDRAPFYATQVFPADVGTCGGVITNEYAQVLDEQDRVIDGLYATGNITATVMGRNYLGAGGSIANTMIFGYVAARHAASH